MSKKLVIAVDMDGTIVKNKWPEIGPLRFGAKWCLKWMIQRRHILILDTCRESRLLRDAMNSLWDCHGILFDYYNQNASELIAQYGGDCRKISADLYLDDKAFFPGWIFVPVIILWMEFKNWQKGDKR